MPGEIMFVMFVPLLSRAAPAGNSRARPVERRAGNEV